MDDKQKHTNFRDLLRRWWWLLPLALIEAIYSVNHVRAVYGHAPFIEFLVIAVPAAVVLLCVCGVEWIRRKK